MELAERLTGSHVSFCHLVDEDQSTLRFLAWSRRTLEACSADREGHFPLDRAGTWADCVRTRRSLVCNDYPAAGVKTGLPEGHAPVLRIVSSPVLDRGKVRMVLGVGNKDADYDDLDVKQVELIAADVWRLARARTNEEAARQVDARFRYLVEGQKALFLEWTLEPVAFTWVGDQLRELLGYEPAEWLADAGARVRAIHPDDREKVVAARAGSGAGDSDQALDYRMVAADGRVVWIHDSVRIVKDPSGRAGKALGLLVDVSEVHRREEFVRELARQSDRQLRTLETILAATPDLVHLFDLDGRVLYVSASALDLYGQSAAEVYGRTWSGIMVGPLARRGESEGVAEVARTGRPFAGLFRLSTPRGLRDVSYQLTPVFGPNGAVDAVVSTGRDVTDELGAQRRIERLNRLYGAVSGLNRAIARSTGPEELLKEVCRVVVATGNFVVAWVAVADPDGRSARFVAVEGPAAELTGDVSISLDPSLPDGRGPTAVAIREGRLVVVPDTLGPDGPERWRDVARRAGLGSGAAVPIFRGRRAGGALAVFAAEKEYFDGEMSGLLEEIARDVSHALDAHDERERRRKAEEELREAARRLTEAERVGGTGSWWFDHGTKLISYSEGADLILGTTSRGPIPVEAESTRQVHPDDVEALRAAMRGVRTSGEPAELENRILRPDGEVRWVRVRVELRRDSGGRAIGSFGTMTDITERKRDEEQRLLWANVLESSREAVVITDSEARIVRVNRAFEEITGYPAAEAVGQNPRILQSGRHDRDFYAAMWAELLAAGRWRGEVWNRRKTGEVYPAFLSLSAVRDASGVSRFVGISSDISEQKSAAERVQFLSHHDALTGLPNRSLFDALLGQSLASVRREKRRLAVLCLDVDLFKTFNESFGHVEGDRLLRDLARRLSGCLRGGDALSRPGGDEFLVLIQSVADAGDLGRIAQKLLDVACQPFESLSRRVTLTASLGIAVHPGDADDAQGLLLAAEAAMYHAKESGRNNFQFFAREMNRRTVEALEMETRLLRAVVGDELFLEFQPQVEIETGRVVGAEALVRWRDPERGVIGPATFIPMAEERGLVVPIGEWVLRRCCEEAVRWQRQGKGTLPVSANISALQFRQAGFEERLSRILEETRVDPGLLELELTESILMKDAEQMIGLLQRLRGRGLRFAIDDFGTGWSSLAYLRRFPIDRLKIDQSFVRDLGHDPGADSIVQAVISLARNLRLRAVAEGVETRKQLAFLRFHGCDEAQGFLLCRPVAAETMWGRMEGGCLAAGPDVVPPK